MSYQFETEKIVDLILKNNFKKVLIQLPDGLKPYASNLAKEISEKTGVIVYVSGDPCYGTCDLALQEAESLGVNLIVHYGHSEFPVKTKINVVYVEAKSNIEVKTVIEKALSLLKDYDKVGLVTNIQHIHKLAEVKKILEEKNKKVFVGSAGGLAKYDGQILGCDYTTAEKIKDMVDVFLYFGGGKFHPLGVFLSTKKPVVAADPYTGEVSNLKELGEKILRQRKAFLAKFFQAKNVGIIVGLKSGQLNASLAEKLQQKLKKMGKHSILICLREISPDLLENFSEVDVFLNTACPRVGFDDAFRYRKPLISVKEFFEAVKE
ncbi:diphthamide biosynthesis enzyme Dph2 [Candidatus Bathyarchaeota archaeon]|nr:MAG: diphthamide biosynthesis enzyme Dph2 [Candidatus Bathyarchaeota archaeon]